MMRLLKWNHQHALSLTSDLPTDKVPRYTILSHTWGHVNNEVNFADLQQGRGRSKAGYKKIRLFGEQARRDGLEHFWVDTCCIDKASSTELSEAINSMYRWYEGAESCCVYLHDVDRLDWQKTFHKSRWFTRGWTLQELLAPRAVTFYDRNWQVLGDKVTLADRISRITGIAVEALKMQDLGRHSVAQKMAWAAKRVTTRPEDRAYCLMGLFGVNMPLLYGEGERAFLRLQEEIIKYSDDHSVFAWSMSKKVRFSGLLATHPRCFVNSRNMVSDLLPGSREPFSMSNRGLSIKLEITPWSMDTYLACLDCAEETVVDERRNRVRMGIFLRRLREDDQYVRINLSGKGLWFDTKSTQLWQDRPTRHRQLFVRQISDLRPYEDCLRGRVYGFKIPHRCLPPFARVSASRISSDRRVATLRPGTWGCVMVIDVSAQHKGLGKIALGFDFEFNPICLLEDSFSETQHHGTNSEHLYDWSVVLADDTVWDEIIEGSRVYRKKTHDGRWALKGHRLRGLDVLLSEHFTDRGSLITMKRDETQPQLLWEFDIDDLIGPFRNHHHPAVKSAFGSRRNFQEAYGFGMAAEGLEQGDDLLKEFFPTMECIEPVL